MGTNVMCTLVPKPTWRPGEKFDITFTGNSIPIRTPTGPPELERFTPPSVTGNETWNAYIYWPGDESSTPHFGPSVVTSAGSVRDMLRQPVGSVVRSIERAGDLPISHHRRPPS